MNNQRLLAGLLIAGIISLVLIGVSYSPIRPSAIFPKWRTIRKIFRREARLQLTHPPLKADHPDLTISVAKTSQSR